MKRILLITLFTILFIGETFSQESVKQNHDSLWYFHPFSIDLLAGVWIPMGKLSEYYSPSAQFGESFGLMVIKKVRVQFWMMPRFLNQNKPLPIKINDSIVYYRKEKLGASIGGWVSYTFYQDKHVSTELMTGVTWENIPTDVQKPNSKDTLSVSGLGLSIGINSWINTFSRLNFGLRAIYTYTTYEKSKYLSSSIGGHSITFSLVYRFPSRKKEFKRWY
jgi:hypothetical protein